jgi:AcrR family transcriptional regulator
MTKQAAGRDQQASAAWQWGRTPKTRRVLLNAAREVFAEQGYSQASIADVVARAGSSVGSLYHHFGGKSELFLALWHEHQRTQEEAASRAVARLRKAGVTDTTELFCAGARAYMEGSWLRRDLALLFFSGDGPPGFEVMKRRRGREWVAQNDVLLGLPDTEMDRLYAAMLTSLIGEGARQVALAPDRREANLITEAVLEYARRLLSAGPCLPAASCPPAPPCPPAPGRPPPSPIPNP